MDDLKFDHPPISEVYCGVFFKDNILLKTSHMGKVCDVFKKEYPITEDMPLLQPPTSDEWIISDLPPLRRVWLKDKAENNIIQIQKNAFFYNWRKNKDDDEYYSYEKLIVKFKENYDTFEKLTKDENLSKLRASSAEITYINNIYGNKFKDVVKQAMPELEPLICSNKEHLSNIESFKNNFIINTTLDNTKIHVSIGNGTDLEGKKVVILKLTGRRTGFVEFDKKEMFEWFGKVHDIISEIFIDFLDEGFRKEVLGQKYD